MTAPGEAAGDMPLTGHLAELRKRILYSLAAVLAGTVICLFFIQNLCLQYGIAHVFSNIFAGLWDVYG